MIRSLGSDELALITEKLNTRNIINCDDDAIHIDKNFDTRCGASNRVILLRTCHSYSHAGALKPGMRGLLEIIDVMTLADMLRMSIITKSMCHIDYLIEITVTKKILLIHPSSKE